MIVRRILMVSFILGGLFTGLMGEASAVPAGAVPARAIPGMAEKSWTGNQNMPGYPAGSMLSASCVAEWVNEWIGYSGSFANVISCILNAPSDGFLFISSNSSLDIHTESYEANFSLTLDGNAINGTNRYVNSYNQPGGNYRNMAVSTVVSVVSGSHSVGLRTRLAAGAGPVRLFYPRLSAFFIPGDGVNLQLCTNQRQSDWHSTSTTFVEYIGCTITANVPGWLFISADASVFRTTGDYWAQFRLVKNQTADIENLERLVQVYVDAVSDGSDENVALTTVQPVMETGPVTFSLYTRRLSGDGEIALIDGNFTALFMPMNSFDLSQCSFNTRDYSLMPTNDVYTVGSCEFWMPEAGWAFISADANVKQANQIYTAEVDIGIDDPSMYFYEARRYISVLDNPSYQDNRVVALSKMRYLSQGRHVIYFSSHRFTGGTVSLGELTISILHGFGNIYLPLLMRQ